MSSAPWQRLHSRMIWVDAVQSVLSLMPAGFAIWVLGVEPTLGSMWPVLAIATIGVVGAVSDALRWVFTRYRVTDEYVERRTGVFVRRYRSVRRDRIRSVDSEAKLRHRLSGLRVLKIGAGQQAAANESALELDAIVKHEAEELRHALLWGSARDVPAPVVEPGTQVFARLRPRWVVYNMFNAWAYLMALGLLWGTYWLGTSLGLDVAGFADGLLDWERLGWGRGIALVVLAVGAVGVAGLAVNFFTEYWKFELARIPGEKGTFLRTRHGLFKTREVNRDDNRMRGIHISEPLLWRWMGMADTNVITTGLNLWSMAQPTTILPRGPISVARPVAAAVLGVAPNPFEVTLNRHPRAALVRRTWWATATTGGILGALGWLTATDVVPAWSLWAGLALWPVSVGCALVAYRALGHCLAGDHLVVRGGLVSRGTAVLQLSAVSTIGLRESVLQRRLGLRTVSAMTSAGWGAYEAADVGADEAVEFAVAVAPGLLAPFVVTEAGDHDTAPGPAAGLAYPPGGNVHVMTEPGFDPDDVTDERVPGRDEPDAADLEAEDVPDVSEDPNLDPGADLDAEGVPDVADESTPGKGEVPDPEVPVAPTDAPTIDTEHNMGADDLSEASGIDAAVAAEEAEEPEHMGEDGRGGPAEEAALRVEDEESILDGEPPRPWER